MIIRVEKGQDPYARIDKVPINDNRLSWKSRGVLLYLLSKPDDWRVMVADLINQSPQGERAVRSALRELKKFGYLEQEFTRENGRITGSAYVVHERPINTPFGQKLHVEKLHVENAALLIKEEALTNDKDIKEAGGEKITMNFPDLKREEKFELLTVYNAQLPYKDRLGLLADLFLTEKDNVKEFTEMVPSGKMYSMLTKLIHTYTTPFLAEWFAEMKHIPIPPNKNWYPYLLGSAKKEHQRWSIRYSIEEGREHKKQEEEIPEFIRMLLKEGMSGTNKGPSEK